MPKSKLVCLNDKVIVYIARIPKVTESGIELPDSAVTAEEPTCGIVKFIGDAVENISVNDKVHFAKFVGTELMHEGTEYKVMRATDIVAKEVVELEGPANA